MRTSMMALRGLLAFVCLFALVACGGGGGSSTPQTPVVSNPTPTISSLSPISVAVAAAGGTLTINGSGFIASSVVNWGNTAHQASFVSASQMQLTLSSADVQSAATVQLTVTNPAPGGGKSNAVSFLVANPVPTVASISPAVVIAGSPDSTVTVTGTNFVSTSVVQFNGNPRSTTFVSATQLQVTVTSADIASGGTAQITVANAAPGGGTSAAAALTVQNPAPVVQSIAPAAVAINSADTVVMITGSGFVPTSVVQLDGQPRATNFVSGTQLQATLTWQDFLTIRTAQITVSNSTPGGGSSGAITFNVQYPPPVIAGLTPSQFSVHGSGILNVTGTGFTLSSVVRVNGIGRQTTYLDVNNLSVSITSADTATAGPLQITVWNPAPGGGASAVQNLMVAAMAVTYVTPQTIYAGSSDTTLTVYGGGFDSGAVVQWNGTALATTNVSTWQLTATVPTANLVAVGNASVTVRNSDASVSNAMTVGVIANPVPSIYSINPSSAPVGSAPVTLTIYGNGVTPASVVQWNGTPLATHYNSGSLVATLSAELLRFGTFDVTVMNPAPGGGVSNAVSFSTYLPLTTNDLVYDPITQRLYASVPSTAPLYPNSVVAVDPVTGNITGNVFVGSDPKRLAVSTDGTALWVGLDTVGAVRKVDLTTMTAGVQFSLGGGPGMYNPPFTAIDLAVMPGSPNTVAVYTQGFPNSTITIYDSGVARPNTYTGGGYLAFDSSGTKLYTIAASSSWSSGYSVLTVDANGVTGAVVPGTSIVSTNAIRFDNGHIFTTNGTMLDAATGALIATFYAPTTTYTSVASGPVAPDSANNRVFILNNNYSSQAQILAFSDATYVSTGAITVSGLDTSYGSAGPLVRFGQDGLAFRTNSQVFLLHSKVVKDMTSTPADVAVSVSAPATGTTGANLVYMVTVTNHGPNAANDVVLFDSTTSGTLLSTSPSQGSCGTGALIRCNLGTLANGASATVQFTIVGNTAGPVLNAASVSATQPDPDMTNNTAQATVALTGADYNPVPVLSQINPVAVAAGTSGLTLNVTGSGFVNGSVVRWNGADRPTTFVNPTSLTATINAADVGTLGWASVTVASGAPGGGSTLALPFTIFTSVSLETNAIAFDPFSRKIFATVPSTATFATGNSVVTLDPAGASFSTPVNVGSQPNQVAMSDDGAFMFIGLDGAKSITRFNLKTNATDLTFSLGTDPYGSTLGARTLAVAPGNPNLLAVDTGSWPGIALYDIAGGTATRRSKLTGPYTGSSVIFADSTHLYSYDTDTSGAEFYRWTVDPTGVLPIDGTTLNGLGGYSGRIQLSKGLVYGASGGVINPTTSIPSMVGKFPASGAFAADGWLGRAFYMNCGYSSPCATITAYDQSTFSQSSVLALSNTTSTTYGSNAVSVIRWGNDGLAVRTTDSSTYGSGATQVYFLRGPFVVPQLQAVNAVATVTAASPNSATAGAGNTYVTITGSGFVPGAVVMWNGGERTTSVVDSTHVSVAIPYTDLAAAGTASITVLNPGAAAVSSPLTFTIN